VEEKLLMIGCYVPKELHMKFRIKCFLNGTNLSKELYALIMADTKNIDLSKYDVIYQTIKTKDEELKKIQDAKTASST
jgi:hypothetical protein